MAVEWSHDGVIDNLAVPKLIVNECHMKDQIEDDIQITMWSAYYSARRKDRKYWRRMAIERTHQNLRMRVILSGSREATNRKVEKTGM